MAAAVLATARDSGRPRALSGEPAGIIRPVRIGIDVRKLHDFGIGTYIRNLLKQLARLDRETEFMVANDAIEVALRPIPSANVFIPYQATIPTLAGSAAIFVKRIEIDSPGKPQIALTH